MRLKEITLAKLRIFAIYCERFDLNIFAYCVKIELHDQKKKKKQQEMKLFIHFFFFLLRYVF